MSSAMHLTAHAAARMAQRGIAESDLELITCIGTEVEDGYLVREKDFQALDQQLKQLRQRLRRLVGKRVVTQGNCVVVTACHAGYEKERRRLRAPKPIGNCVKFAKISKA
jgi:hypothetical protein